VDLHDPVASVEALQVGAGDGNLARGGRVGKVRPVANSRVLRTRKLRQTRYRLRKIDRGTHRLQVLDRRVDSGLPCARVRGVESVGETSKLDQVLEVAVGSAAPGLQHTSASFWC
jgi:hypothetical protein